MEKVHPWCGQPSDPGRLKNRTELKDISKRMQQLHSARAISSTSYHGVLQLTGRKELQ